MAQIIGAYDTNVKTSLSALKKVTATTSGTKDSLDVNITNASAVGGEQYADAYTITGGEKGTVALGSDGTDFKYLKTDSSGILQVDIVDATGVTVDVNLDNSNDDVLVYGFDGTTNRAIKTDASGNVQVDVLTQPALASGTDSIAAVQSGTWDINDISGTISLPTGAATAAKQLADGHNVTVDNASGASAVNIQDGGNSITIDATALPLPTGAATEVTLAAVETDTGSIDTKLTTTNTKLTDIETNTDALAGVTSTGTALDVNISSGTVVANIEGDYVDDSAFTVAVDKGIMVGGFFTTDTVDSGDFGAFKINADRELGVFLGESIPTGSNVIGAVTQSGTWDINDISGTISLPTGAATEATLSSIDTDTSTIATKVTDIETNTDSLAVTGGGLEATALRVTLANDSTGVLTVDDGGGSLTVDGTVAATQSGTWNIGTLTSITNDVSIDDGGNSITVDDGGSSLTVDGTVTANQGGSWSVTVLNDGRTRSKYTEVSAGIPPNSIVWNSTASGPILNKFRILGITCHFAGAPVANDFIVQLNDVANPLLNVIFWKVDPGTLGLTDISWHPTGEIIIDPTSTESLDIMWTNGAPQVDWGLRVIIEELV